ncbi:hypothetical protein Syun_020119 [Stephania yunnanensis]|uniref:Germin-like protein n=1 Tax=Stephania yunnanensis TaxID=152371 RepID=A0AAP0IDM4_9MAGN
MKSHLYLPLLLCSFCFTFISTSFADDCPVQDLCPTAHPSKGIPFVNGFPCKNPATAISSDFISSILSEAGDTENFLRSSMKVVTAADFPGLNTLGISLARTDLDFNGVVLPHSHPRASELLYVSSGVVTAGFVDTQDKLFQMTLRKGDVFVFPRGLHHFCLNAGFELATIFSVHNSQNPGVVNIAGAAFNYDLNEIAKLVSRLRDLSTFKTGYVANVTVDKLFNDYN